MIRTITLNRDGQCAKCGHALQAGRRARWTPQGNVFCLSNAHHGHLTIGQYRAHIAIAEGTINFEFSHGRITLDQRDERLAALRGAA